MLQVNNYYQHENLISGFFNQTNTFQCILARSENQSFAIYLYADGLIHWASGGGRETVIGYNAGGKLLADSSYGGEECIPTHWSSKFWEENFDSGDKRASFTIYTASGTCGLLNIASRSNVNIPGMWVFRLDQKNSSQCGKKHLIDRLHVHAYQQ